MKTLKFILFSCLLPAMLLCCCSLRGVKGVSDTILESKKNGVFISEYKAISNPIYINDTIIFTMSQIWLEKQFTYDSIGDVLFLKGIQMCINTQEQYLRGYYQEWIIGSDVNNHFFQTGDFGNPEEAGLLCRMNDNPLIRDTFYWDIQKGDNLMNNENKFYYGKLILVRVER